VIDPRRSRRHDVELVSAVKSRTIEKFFELAVLGSLKNLLKGDQIWGDPSQLAIEKTHSTWIACVVPYIDGEDR
jgi:hypothetical protein